MSAKPQLEFLDTNVIYYAYDSTAGVKYEQAQALVSELWFSRRGCISIQVLQEFYTACTRNRSIKPPDDLRTIVQDLSRWRIFSPSANDVLAAIDLHRRYQVSFWDAMIVHSASRLGCSIVWSEDLNAGQWFGRVHVQNPFLGQPQQ
jgi:predicted nucleic acid-binding protein